MATVVTPMTTEELLALPDDGVRRWLIDGELRESPRITDDGRESPMTVRNRFHSQILIRIGQHLANWLDEQPEPRGRIMGGEAGVRLSRDPDTTVGIDVVYVSHEVMAKQTDESTLIEGVPTLVVEIQSPSDTLQDQVEKLGKYRKAKVPVVWIINPYHETVTVHRLNAKVRSYNTDEGLSGEPELPGFRVPVARLFE